MQARSHTEFKVQCLFEEFSRLGLRTVCIAPGSRSSLLVKAAAEHPDLETIVHYDERSLGFFALGIAKAQQSPVGIICTSGSAVANLLPACVEAFQLKIPLLLLTADRPEELHHCGSNQTIEQASLFNGFSVLEETLDCEALSEEALLRTVNSIWMKNQEGPVHVNLPFREPFFQPQVYEPQLSDRLSLWQSSGQPFLQSTLEGETSVTLDLLGLSGKRCLCIVGNTAKSLDTNGFVTAVENAGIAVLSECNSSLSWDPRVIRQLTAQIQRLREHDLLPEVILCVGSKWISKQLHRLLEETASVYLIHDFNETQDWLKMAENEILCDCETLTEQLSLIRCDQPYVESVKRLCQPITLNSGFSEQQFTEEDCLRCLSDLSHYYDHCFLGNSLSVRLANDLLAVSNTCFRTYTSRGASGIDGLVSTAAGLCYAVKEPVVALLGDLSFLHDLNGLYFLKEQQLPLMIVVLNNNGGGIFGRLPIKNEAIFEQYFRTPHSVDLDGFCKSFSLHYRRIENRHDWEGFTKVRESFSGPVLLDVIVES